jgi:hypothetical protein
MIQAEALNQQDLKHLQDREHHRLDQNREHLLIVQEGIRESFKNIKRD